VLSPSQPIGVTLVFIPPSSSEQAKPLFFAVRMPKYHGPACRGVALDHVVQGHRASNHLGERGTPAAVTEGLEILLCARV